MMQFSGISCDRIVLWGKTRSCWKRAFRVLCGLVSNRVLLSGNSLSQHANIAWYRRLRKRGPSATLELNSAKIYGRGKLFTLWFDAAHSRRFNYCFNNFFLRPSPKRFHTHLVRNPPSRFSKPCNIDIKPPINKFLCPKHKFGKWKAGTKRHLTATRVDRGGRQSDRAAEKRQSRTRGGISCVGPFKFEIRNRSKVPASIYKKQRDALRWSEKTTHSRPALKISQPSRGSVMH